VTRAPASSQITKPSGRTIMLKESVQKRSDHHIKSEAAADGRPRPGEGSGDLMDGVNDPAHLEYPERRTLALRAERRMRGPSTIGERSPVWEAGALTGADNRCEVSVASRKCIRPRRSETR
jgi:hypothetical protein